MDSPSDDETTPLHFAAAQENPEVVRLLLARGAYVDAEDVLQETPLHKVRETPIGGPFQRLVNSYRGDE